MGMHTEWAEAVHLDASFYPTVSDVAPDGDESPGLFLGTGEDGLMITGGSPGDIAEALRRAIAALPCEYVVEGTDTDGTVWHRCATHDETAPSADAPCARSAEPASVWEV